MRVPSFETAQNIVLAMLLSVWFGGTLLLYFRRFRPVQRAYLKRFPPVEGIPLDIYVGGGPRTVRRAIYRVMLRKQADDQLERMRREMWRSYRLLALWIFGVPVIPVALSAVAIATGFVRFR